MHGGDGYQDVNGAKSISLKHHEALYLAIERGPGSIGNHTPHDEKAASRCTERFRIVGIRSESGSSDFESSGPEQRDRSCSA
jgi:hypothetical protein